MLAPTAAADNGPPRGTTTGPGVAPAQPAVEQHADPDSPTPQQVIRLDARQDELMGVESPDGPPPSHRLRRLEWWALGIGVSLVAVAGIAWAAARQVHWATLLAGSGLVLVLLAAGAPVWGAALLRGKEERRARREAQAELRDREDGMGG